MRNQNTEKSLNLFVIYIFTNIWVLSLDLLSDKYIMSYFSEMLGKFGNRAY